MSVRFALPLVALALFTGSFAAQAQTAASCEAAEKALGKAEAALTKWNGGEPAKRSNAIGVSMAAGLARAYASDEAWNDTAVDALDGLRVVRDLDDPNYLETEMMPAAVYRNAADLAAELPALCPDTVVPDFTPFEHYAQEQAE